jgi:hypothetical protein
MAVDRKLIRSGFIDEDNRLKKEIDEQASAIDSTVKEHTADRIKKEILRKVTCGKPAVCKRAITSYMKTVKGPMKTKMDEMKRGIRDLKQKLKQNAATRKAMIGDAADTSLRSKTEYLQTPFGAVRDKCVKIMKKSESLDKQVAEKLAPITAEIEQNTELIVQYDKDYKAKVAELAARKAELLKLSRSTPAAKKAYTEFVKEMPKTRRAWMADLRKKKTGTRRDIRNLISRKKKTARKTRTQIKKDYTARVKSLKKQNASAIKARVAARKNGALVDEIEHEYFKGLVDDGVKAVQSEADAVASAAENRDKK